MLGMVCRVLSLPLVVVPGVKESTRAWSYTGHETAVVPQAQTCCFKLNA